MKKFLLLSLLFSLSGCLYIDGCIKPLIQTVSSGCYKDRGETFPSISQYQLPHSIGKTDSEQRWKDVIACGGKYGDYKEESITTVEKREKFYHCMLKKGYITFTPAECGFQNPKWDKKVCNL